MANGQDTPLTTPPTTPPTTSAPANLSVDDLAGKIREKFPGSYDAVDNTKLVHAWLQKYPVYQTHLTTDALNKLSGIGQIAPATGAEGLAVGATKAGLQTIQGVTKLANKILPSGTQIPMLGEGIPLETKGGWEKTGEVGENLAEFFGGEAALKGIASLSKLSKVPQLLELAEKYPKTLKILTSAGIGAAQGGAKGAATDEAGKGALGGAVGGAVGAGIGEAISPGAKALGKMLGLGGWTPEQAMVKAFRPSVNEGKAFREAIQTAAPRIVQAAENTPLKTLGDFEDLLHNAAQDIRKNEFGPLIQNNGHEIVQAGSIRSRILNAITPQMRQYAPEEVNEIRDFASRFNDMRLDKAEQDLQYFNAELRKFYKMNPVERAANLKLSGTMAKYEAAADALRDSIYSKIKSVSPSAVPEALQKQYGALKDLERVVAKRATVADRAAPLNLSEVIGLISGAMEGVGAVAAGHPMLAAGAAIPYLAARIAKRANAPETLMRLGVRAMKPPSTVIAPAATQAGKFLSSAAGALSGREFTTGAPSGDTENQ